MEPVLVWTGFRGRGRPRSKDLCRVGIIPGRVGIFHRTLLFRPAAAAGKFPPMKRLLPLLLLSAVPSFAELVTVRESLILKAERAAISVKAGTEVELVSRDADTVTIKYRNVTGKIPASKLEGAAAPTEAPAVAEKKPLPAAAKPLPDDGQDKSRAGSSQQREPAGQTPGGQPPATVPAKPPQTTYGKAVQKAKDNAAAHDKNAVKPVDEILKE
jgi:hypothetical protein